MEKRIKIKGAWDKRHENPEKNYGVHGVEIYMALIGDKGAISTTIFTNWQLPEVQKTLIGGPEILYRPIPAGVWIHSLKPQYEGQNISKNKCDFLGMPCYCDGLTTDLSEKIFNALLEKGEDGVWEEFQILYDIHIR